MAEPKTYINGILTNSHSFGDGSEIIKLGIPVTSKRDGVEFDNIAALEKQLRAAAKNGWVNLVISPRLNQEKNKTHSIYVDTYEPKAAPAQGEIP